MTDSNLIQKTKILTAATLISKIIGFLYVVPLTAMVSTDGMGLYSEGYQPYQVLLSLATLGVPLAMSKFVSKYHTLGDYETAHRLFRSGIIFMLVTGIIGFLLLFSAAPILAEIFLSLGDKKSVYTVGDTTLVIRMVSVALIIVPAMAIIRGYFQGFGQMVPTAISQVIEQLVRVSFILAIVFYIMKTSGDVVLAVGFATFGAFIGAIGGGFVLIWYYMKERPTIAHKVSTSAVRHRLPLVGMYKEIIRYALPISFVGLSIPLFQLIDVATIENALGSGAGKEYKGILVMMVHKLVLIPMALATALSITLVPTITQAYTSGEKTLLQRNVFQSYQMILFICIPAAFGLVVLAEPIYGAIYGVKEQFHIGVETLMLYGPITLIFSLYAVTGAILQGLNRQKYAMISLAIGLLAKVILAFPLLWLLGRTGAIWTSYIGFGLALAMNVWAIGKFAQFRYNVLLKRALLIFMISLIMTAATWIISRGLMVWLPIDSRLSGVIVTAISISSAIVCYFFLTVRVHLAGEVLGERFRFLNRRGY
ncbi:putative polysaccharide biosynthesis protein [Shouchella lonarensis]|uniref:Membrane protein involved in the export of O-antigen and teichoic acid n=1 Tax=Shouchella lonarensis TaxID=1464122 RepID=A0A1G6GH73_9BACI|nr:polysaccharide biosynthesis protein [Shouchella lonarensis]SDB81105.1 Membrane protein involved in the export of O-antigen and teichoic acid [Shouchella lonarensis]